MLEHIIEKILSREGNLESICFPLKGLNELDISRLINSYGDTQFVSHDGICVYDNGNYSIEITFLDCLFKENILCGKSFELYVINGSGTLVSQSRDEESTCSMNSGESTEVHVEPGSKISYISYESLFRVEFAKRILCLVVYDSRKCESDIEYYNNDVYYIDADKNISRIKNIISLSSAHPEKFTHIKNNFLSHHDHSVRLKYIIEYLRGSYGDLDYDYIKNFMKDDSKLIRNFLDTVISYDNN
ncbi:hypothetical protein ACVD4U_003891 [Vibrio vulnificus]|nr:hypothetical protein [Vibrio vulnificus]MCU8133793.1 hypothetical protein [Vibrio vulnificus]